MDVPQVLRDARRLAGLSQRALARRARVAQPTVARIESGVVVPRVDTLDNLLGVCGWSLTSEQSPGRGVDRSSIRALLELAPADRLRLAAREARNLDRLLTGATRR
jgi:transcriptional regulator with XRE-family HTH domain